MKIQIGEVQMDKVAEQNIMVIEGEYLNQVVPRSKSNKYLLPCLRAYGKTFISKLNAVTKVATGLGDIIVENTGIVHEKHLFILLDSKSTPKQFREFLSWIREQKMYEDDYVFDNIQKSDFHMVIIKFPQQYYSSFMTFKKGDYSKMYTMEQIDDFFMHHPQTKKVLVKDKDYKIVFTKRLNKLYNTHLIPDDVEKMEYDLPPSDETEIFNHHLKKK